MHSSSCRGLVHQHSSRSIRGVPGCWRPISPDEIEEFACPRNGRRPPLRRIWSSSGLRRNSVAVISVNKMVQIRSAAENGPGPSASRGRSSIITRPRRPVRPGVRVADDVASRADDQVHGELTTLQRAEFGEDRRDQHEPGDPSERLYEPERLTAQGRRDPRRVAPAVKPDQRVRVQGPVQRVVVPPTTAAVNIGDARATTPALASPRAAVDPAAPATRRFGGGGPPRCAPTRTRPRRTPRSTGHAVMLL